MFHQLYRHTWKQSFANLILENAQLKNKYYRKHYQNIYAHKIYRKKYSLSFLKNDTDCHIEKNLWCGTKIFQ